MTKLVVVGLGSGGFAAVLSACKTDPKAEITIVDEKEFDLLHSCGLPYAISGEISPAEKLKQKLSFPKNVKILNKTRALSIDAEKKELSVEEIGSGKKFSIPFDSLILSTGGKPFLPKIEGARELLGKSVFLHHSIDDLERLMKALPGKKTALVVGGGAIGLEVTAQLQKKGLAVSLAEMLGQLLPNAIDADLAELVKHHLEKIGVLVLLDSRVEKIEKAIATVNGKKTPAEIVVLATGVKCDYSLAETAGLKKGANGLIVDEKMETNVKGIFAIGDITDAMHSVSGKPFSPQIASTAYAQGLVAGANAVGGTKKYEGSLGTFATTIGELEVAATGLTMKYAGESGIETVESRVRMHSLPEWFDGEKEIVVKLLAGKKSGKIIGAQAFGFGAFHRINIVSAAIKAGFTAKQLAEIEMAYCPPLSDVRDALQICAELLERKMGKV
ncbi:MAG: FAD-dependent oxidoreductase [Candidatus Diapherotrites archaeon]